MRARRGTTVLELVVALVVTGVVATVGASAFEQVIARRSQVLQATTLTERDSALRTLLREWIDSGSPEQPAVTRRFEAAFLRAREIPRIPGARAIPLAIPARSDGDALYFSTTVVTMASAPTVRVRLYVDDDPDTAERGLTLEYQRVNGQAYTRQQLEPSVRGLRVTYLEATTRQWRTQSQLSSAPVLAARVELLHADSQRSRLMSLPLTFPMDRAELSAMAAADQERP